MFRGHFRYICLTKCPPRHTGTEGKEVDLENRLIHVRNAVKPAGNIPGISPPKSKAGIRDVPINDSLLDILRRCSSKQGFGITGERNPNGAMSSCGMNRQWQRIKRKIDVHGATPHVFRHPFAALIHPHTDIKTLQTIMGHSDIETTLDRYTHFVHENVEKLAQINPYCNTAVTSDTPQTR
ncbi:MAG: site-specific integrase [Clostridia bacterium]|nr:site-specific integrase [Clostridia bacterium]